MGSLHIFVTYLSAGTDSLKRRERLQQLDSMGEAIKARAEALSIIAGDFNFVETQGDRKAKNEMLSESEHDKEETN